MFRLSREKFVLLAILIILLPALSGFLKPGFYATHDVVWHISRFWQFNLSLESGQFPVRWAPTLYFGLGYPTFIVNFHLPYYLMELIYRFGFGPVDTFKIVIALSYVASIYFFYIYLRRFFATLPSIAGAVVFAYCPYRFATMFARGALGEAVAIAFVPLVLLAFDLWRSKNKYAGPFLALSIFLLVTSHTSIFTVFSPILIILIFLAFWKIKRIDWALLGWLALGLIASSFQLLPAFFEKDLMQFDKVYSKVYLGHFVNLFTIFRIKLFGADLNTPFQLGVAGYVGVIGFLIFGIRKVKLKNYTDSIAAVYLIGFLTGVFLMSSISLMFWEKVPLLNLVLYPWRFINLILLSGAFLGAYFVNKFRPKVILAILLMLIAFIPSRHFWKWQGHIPTDDFYYINYHGTTTAEGEYTPRGVTEAVKQYNSPTIEILEGDARILNEKNKPNNWQFDVEAKENTKIKLANLNFPGWKAAIDGKEVNIIGDYKNNEKDLFGLIVLELGGGYHNVRVYFTETPLRMASDVISLGALIFLSFIFFKRRFRV